jgi:predicted hotdog family 3-hydroxylacyl-ACP dehydratase
MILLDEVLGWDEGKVRTLVSISPESPFYIHDKGVPAYVGLEYMAQTCGVYAGIEGFNEGKPVRLGFLLGTRNYHSSASWFHPGDRLIIDATEIYRQETMGVFDCRIMLADAEVASAQVNLYQPENAADTFGNLPGNTAHG